MVFDLLGVIGQMTKYERYISTLDSMQEPIVPMAKLDMRGAMLYARSMGKKVYELSAEEKSRFIIYLK